MSSLSLPNDSNIIQEILRELLGTPQSINYHRVKILMIGQSAAKPLLYRGRFNDYLTMRVESSDSKREAPVKQDEDIV